MTNEAGEAHMGQMGDRILKAVGRNLNFIPGLYGAREGFYVGR